MYIVYVFTLLFSPASIISAIIRPAVSLPFPSPLWYFILTDRYTPRCHRVNSPGMPGLNPTNCETTAEIICQHFKPWPPSRGGSPTNQWIWIEQPGCALAFYLPEHGFQGTKRCLDIFSGLIDECAFDSRFNAGSINVAVLPDFGQDGRAEDARFFMYLLAPERLTL